MRPSRAIPLALLLAVAVRVPFWIEALRTPVDADTAIVGLMARHPGEGTTFWGQPYGSPLDSWVAIPFVALWGTRTEALRLPYFLLGLALVPLAYGLGRALRPSAALPAAVLVACAPPYLILLSALPPPLYSTTLVLCGLVLLLAVHAGRALDEGRDPRRTLVLVGLLGGLALWTHLMSASTLAAAGIWLLLRARGRRTLLVFALAPFLVASAPLWLHALQGGQATRIVQVAARDSSALAHLAEVAPRLHEPLGGLLGTHVPVVADAEDFMLRMPGWMSAGIVLLYGGLLSTRGASRAIGPSRGPLSARCRPRAPRVPLPRPRCAAHDPLPDTAVSPARRARGLGGRTRKARRAGGGWRCWPYRPSSLPGPPGSSRPGAPRIVPRRRFSSPTSVRCARCLPSEGVRHAYASYGPAWRLSWESGERVVASQPWNERFRHWPLPWLDEVRFAKNAAWVLTPGIPTDLPSPADFEEGLRRLGGRWRRKDLGAAVVFLDFVPPYSPHVRPWPGAGEAGDGDPRTFLTPDPAPSLRAAYAGTGVAHGHHAGRRAGRTKAAAQHGRRGERGRAAV